MASAAISWCTKARPEGTYIAAVPAKSYTLRGRQVIDALCGKCVSDAKKLLLGLSSRSAHRCKNHEHMS